MQIRDQHRRISLPIVMVVIFQAVGCASQVHATQAFIRKLATIQLILVIHQGRYQHSDSFSGGIDRTIYSLCRMASVLHHINIVDTPLGLLHTTMPILKFRLFPKRLLIPIIVHTDVNDENSITIKLSIMLITKKKMKLNHQLMKKLWIDKNRWQKSGNWLNLQLMMI